MNAWLAQHGQALSWAVRRLGAAPVNTLLSLVAIGIALALPAGGQMLLGNALQLARSAGTDNATPQISLFLTLDADRKAADGIATRLKNLPNAKEVRFVSREEALKRMQAGQGLAEVIAALPKNPFPDAFVVKPRDESPAATESMREEISRWAKVEHVQLDSAWVRRLDAMLRLGRIGVALLTLLLGLGLVAITFTTIRLQILAQRAEIEVSRLLGAAESFIRRPFYYFGALQGLAGGVVAWLIVMGMTALLSGPVADLAQLYNTSVTLSPLANLDALLLLVLAGGLGWLGAALSLGQHTQI
ncbi:MAG: permease-like cell division protein FtsX [Proteobacteria bacterium]|nr:permease-like cell division protein FtsX [Pseudomonadota bacterium]